MVKGEIMKIITNRVGAMLTNIIGSLALLRCSSAREALRTRSNPIVSPKKR